MSAKRLRIGKLWVDVLRFDEALDAVEALVRAGQGGNVFTPNVDHVVSVESNEAFRIEVLNPRASCDPRH